MATMTTASPGVDMTLVVKTSTGKHFQLVVSRAASVLEFKEKCQEPAEVPANEQRLIYKGRALQDGDLLTEYDVTDQCTIHLLRAPPRQPQAPPQQPQLAANGLLAGGLGGMQLPSDPASLQRRLMSDPELTARILDSPFTRSLLDDPNLLRQMVNANPQLRRAMDANPQLRHALQDPNLLREAVEVARNPARAREAMRHQDLALSQLENHPEGFNALRRMYSEVQEPLMEGFEGMAVSSGGASAAPVNADPDAPLPNPWAPAPQQAPPALPGPMPFDPQLMAQLMGGQGGGVPDMFDVLRGGVAPPRPNPARPPPPAENPWAHLDGDGGAGDDDDDIYG